VDSFLPLLRQADIQIVCQNELAAFYAQVRRWEGHPSFVDRAYRTRLLLEDLHFSENVPGVASLLRNHASSVNLSPEEQARTLFAAYLQDAGDSDPTWRYTYLYSQVHPVIELLQQETNDRVKVLLILVAFQEVYTLFATADWQKIPALQAVALIKALRTEKLSYTAENIQDVLQSILKLFSLENYHYYEYEIQFNTVIFDLLLSWEPLLRQADILAPCQAEVTALYALAARWGNFSPLQEAYRARMMFANLLFADNPPVLASLLRDYAQAGAPSIEEQARNCLAAYHQELGDYGRSERYSMSVHPLQELLCQGAQPLLKVQLIRDAFQEAYSSFQPHTSDQPATFVQAKCLVEVLHSPDLPYSSEDIRSILESLVRIFSLPDNAYEQFDTSYRNNESLFCNVLQPIVPLLKQPETLAFYWKEASQLYLFLSQCQWGRPDDWKNTLRLQMRSLLFPESAGPLLDLLHSHAHFESESDLQALLTAYHQDLGGGEPGSLEPAHLQSLKQKLTPQATVRLLCMIAADGPRLQAKSETLENSHQSSQDFLLLRTFCKKSLPFSPEDIHIILHGVTAFKDSLAFTGHLLINTFASRLNEPEVLERCYTDLETIRQIAEEHGYQLGYPVTTAQNRQFKLKLQDLLSKRQQEFRYPILPDAWASPILEELAAFPAEERDPWLALLNHCVRATMSTPTSGWLEQAQSLMAALESDTFTSTIHRWISFFSDKKGGRMDGNNSDILRGLLWLCIGSSDRALASILADTAIEGYRKLSGQGPRCPKAGDAAVISLEGMRGRDAIAQLERVRRNVKQPSYQAKIGRALDAVAQREQMTRIDLEELMVPTFDLHDGQLQVPVGSWMAQLTVSGRGVQQRWIDPEGNQQYNLPASIKRGAKEELKALKRLVADIEHLVSDQRLRLEHMYLNERHWTLEDWRERYLDHPLLSVLARCLIWQVRKDSQSWRVIWHKGVFVDAETQQVELSGEAEVTLWHPLMSNPEEVQRWCIWLETQRITQPFKQAHREIYPLTEAERANGRISERFAGHFIRQHQLNALARARGWQFSLHSDFSGTISDDPVTLQLPQFGIRAEFAVSRLPDEEEEIPRYLTTSQVRFPLLHLTPGIYYHTMQLQPLEQVPPLVFSEVMRDIDLFVSVTSAGADPYGYAQPSPSSLQEYWRAYNQGELSLSALGRKQVLERLLPMLEIGERCSLEDRFLRVRGDLCTYRIHLGSGNILMEPGQQYLCIVFDTAAQEPTEGQFFLPFEGDSLLALILSKAFLLAADTQIKDQSILSQIRSNKLA
jgi:Domain of unknown function (DUF4132)